MIVAFVCTRCGAPLPQEMAGDGFVTCEYCGTTHHVSAGSAKEVKAGSPSAAVLAAEAQIQRQRKFIAGLQDLMKSGQKAYDAIVSSAREHMGASGQSDVMARVVIALAEDFDRENGTKAVRDGQCIGRIAEAYLKACAELRTTQSTEINLPFLTATGDGPKHFTRAVTAVDFAQLATRSPAVEPPPAPAPAPDAEPPKKKGWWPF